MANLFKVTQDTRGRYRRQNLGKKVGHDGHIGPATFILGADYEEACKRSGTLERMWEAIRTTWGEDTEPTWKRGIYEIALEVAKGVEDIRLTLPQWATEPALATGFLADLRQLFPFLHIRYGDQTAQESVKKVADQLEKDGNAILDRVRVMKETGGHNTLHHALDAYHTYVTDKYSGKSNQRPQQRLVKLLKGNSPNNSLDNLDADAIDQWLAVWCKRPAGQKGPLALTTCRNALIALRQFLRWLARSPRFLWDMPGGYNFPRCRIDKLMADRVKRRQHFTRAELSLLWQYAHPWDRTMILLALNCGFSKREIATLQKGEVVQRKDRAFIQRNRTKSDVYGEWELWEETCAALAYLSHRPNQTAHIVVNQTGKLLVKGTPKGNENQTIKNHWDRLLDRIIADYPKFHRLPFKHLRKTGATFIRKLSSGEVASMYLAHGESSDDKDQLLSVYTSRPWRKVHKALRKLRVKLVPIFQSVPDPWKEMPHRISPHVKQEVLALRKEGKAYQEIAKSFNLHLNTVGRICRSVEK